MTTVTKILPNSSHKAKFSHINLFNYRRSFSSGTSDGRATTVLTRIDNTLYLPKVNQFTLIPENITSKVSEPSNSTNDKCLYSNIIKLENIELGLARTKSGISAGLDVEIKATYTANTDKLKALSEKLKSHKYKPSPSKKVWIPKPDGGKRPLAVSNQQDKIVQAAILCQLEAVLEKDFRETSYGFRPKKGCHDALHRIKRKWQNVTWIINMDINKYFDTVHHDILIELLEPYTDQATRELIRKLLNAGYIDIHYLADVVERAEVGLPQGSLISPLLANLYLNQLDLFVENELIPTWNIGDERKYVAGYQSRKRLSANQNKLIAQLGIDGADLAIQALLHNKWVNDGQGARDQKDQGFRRLHYIRYADDFILGFSGPREEAEQIQSSIKGFLEDKLKLKVNDEKSNIYHSSDRNIKFLGFFIKYLSPKRTLNAEKLEEGVKETKMIAINSAQLRIPVEHILKRLADKGYAKIRKNGTFRATSNRKLGSFEDKLIVNRYSSVIRGIYNYYQPANQFSDLWPIVALLRKSCALTLADKHKLKTAAKAYRKFGPSLKISDKADPGNTTTLFYPDTLKSTGNFKLGKAWVNGALLNNDPVQGSYKSNPKTSNVCQFPGCKVTNNLQEHHINELRNLNKKGLSPYLKSLIAKRRETVTLCPEHHNLQHFTGKNSTGWRAKNSKN